MLSQAGPDVAVRAAKVTLRERTGYTASAPSPAPAIPGPADFSVEDVFPIMPNADAPPSRLSTILRTSRGLPLRAFLLRPLWLPLLLLLLVTLTVAWSVIRNAQFADLVQQSQKNLTLSENVLNDVIDLETGQRGFVITLDPQFLEPYTLAQARLPQHLLALRDALQAGFGSGWETQIQRVDRVEQLINEWERSGGGLALRLARTDYPAAVAHVKSGQGKRLVDAIRETIDALQEEELVQQRQLARASSSALQTALLVTVLGVSLAVLALYLVFTKTASSVARLLRNLSTTTAGIAQGQVEAPLPPHAITEVAALAANLDSMARALLSRERERDTSLANLSDSEARHRALIAGVPDILLTVNARGEIRSFKPPVEAGNEAWINAMVGHRIPDVLPPHVAGLLMDGVSGSLRTGKPQTTEFTMDMSAVTPATPAPLDFEARTVPVSGQEVLIIARDITDLKRVERLKTEFVSTVSHELRTPLTSIRGALSLIASGALGELPPRATKLAQIGLNNSERLVRLINDLLDMEKIESGQLEFHMRPLDLPPLVQRAAEDNRAYAQQFGVALEVDVPPAPVVVSGDGDRLLQVMTNLISNAVKFSPRDSAVTVSAGAADDRVWVSVRDRGPGIPPDFRSRIFGRFAQADASVTREKGGTGLGLSISKAIVERHTGRLFFEDHPQGGTVFTFELPLAAPLSSASLGGGPSRPLGHVLVCEDDHDAAALLQLILRQAGFSSDVAYTAGEAEDRLAGQPYDALVLDLLLPDQDGAALIQRLQLRSETAGLPVIVVSAVADEHRDLINGDAVSVVAWINKPLDPGQLLTAVGRAAQRGTHRQPRILHVEDDADLRQVVREILRGAAHVEAAESLTRACEALRGGPFDLVLLDPGLPDGNGLDLLPELRAASPSLPVLVFSAGEPDRASAEQVTAALVKSRTSNTQLVETIRALIRPLNNGAPHD